jgi:type VI secretion system secreted protein Hcp
MASDIVARIGTINGESQDKKHRDEIDVLTWSWGVSSTASAASGGGGGAGKSTFSDLTFIHRVDRASPLLLKACATGEHMKDATITVRKAGKGHQEYLVVKLTDVTVTSVTVNVASEAPATSESVSLRFAKVDYEYRAQKPDGTLEPGLHFI